MSQTLITLTLLLCVSVNAVCIAELHLQSGPQQTVMIELYTSEGCNSCPPAERYLNQFVHDKQLWTTYIPLAFHVDYWDYIGWRDRFATSANSRRQQIYGKVLQAPTIYTPEFFVNGKEWRGRQFGGLPQVTTRAVGVLKVSVKGVQVSASFDPPHKYDQALQLHLAVLGMDLQSDIAAGENAGRHAIHQFTVLGHTQTESPTLQWHSELPSIGEHVAPRLALVAWISHRYSPAPLQATGGYLPPSLALR